MPIDFLDGESEERDRRLLFEILFEEASEPTWEEVLGRVEALQHRQAEHELAEVQRSIEANPAGPGPRDLLTRKHATQPRQVASRAARAASRLPSPSAPLHCPRPSTLPRTRAPIG